MADGRLRIELPIKFDMVVRPHVHKFLQGNFAMNCFGRQYSKHGMCGPQSSSDYKSMPNAAVS